MTDYDLALLEQGIYGQAPIVWDFFSDGMRSDSVVWGAVRGPDGVTTIVLRGSIVLKDWLRDVVAFADPFVHNVLGPVHIGFWLGMDATWAEIKANTTGPYRVIGHSLGAGRAAILVGLMIADGAMAVERVVWGEPLSGFQRLADLIAPVAARSYRNGDGKFMHDHVTDVPYSFPPEEFVRASPLIDVNVPPSGPLIKRLGLFAFHHMSLYLEAMKTVHVLPRAARPNWIQREVDRALDIEEAA